MTAAIAHGAIANTSRPTIATTGHGHTIANTASAYDREYRPNPYNYND